MQQTRTHRFPLPIIYPTSGTHRNTDQEQAASNNLPSRKNQTHLPPTNEITQPTTTQPSESAKRSREIILETRRQTEKRQPEYQSTDAQQISTHNKNEDNQTNKSSKRNFSEAISPTTPTHDQTSDAANSPLFASTESHKNKETQDRYPTVIHFPRGNGRRENLHR
nr:unnamed protein product [Callosobruchus analis]